MPGSLYHELQIRMTYNSNRIEGSKLSEDQTRLIFETNTVDVGEGIPVDDIIETVNHFRAVDYVIDHAEEPLTENIIKELHRILKQSTKGSALAWFAVGDYKKRANVAGGRETAKPKDVPARMKALLSGYESLDAVSIDNVIEFHYDFERIHPFQDGNGRVGRLVALKECLRYGIVPSIIDDSEKMFYYRGLSEWETEKGYLTDTCLDGQDTFKELMALFDIRPQYCVRGRMLRPRSRCVRDRPPYSNIPARQKAARRRHRGCQGNRTRFTTLDSQHDAAEIPVHNRSMKRDNGRGRAAPINADKQQAARRADADLQERFP